MTEHNSPAAPDGLRRIAIDPVSRVEGHGKVTLLVDEHHKVQQARLHIVEFRGFEKFIEGRPYWEVPVLVQRLCGICPVSHHLAAVKALDRALGVHAPTPTADKIRRLMHYGQVLQSHALHFFHLASPDLLLGFGADPAARNIVGVIDAFPDVARQGVMLRKFGQEIIAATAGKRIHGTGAVPGGVNRHVEVGQQKQLLAQWSTMLEWAQAAVDLIARLHEAQRPMYEAFGATPAAMLSLVAPDGAMELYDGALRVRDAEGRIMVDQHEDQAYSALIEEAVKPWSYMKFPYLRDYGEADGWYRVGPLARLQNCDHISTPLAEAARQRFVDWHGGQVVHASLAFHWARMIEMLHATEMAGLLLQDPDILSGERMAEGQRGTRGVGIIEAPRGTLIHEYEVGNDDLISYCNLIVATTHNNTAMNEAVRKVAEQFLDGHEITEPLLNHIEIAIRAYDPCLSCATHALGQMPLTVSLRTMQGDLLDHVGRGSDGRLLRGLTANAADTA
ncbi:Ni/Fe hydrogenase subunit alpha [Hydrogenophaga sp. 5NK40-0174]|uniref:Ni/Fe hydrogenase subunit alpha n=1 Tax=Hydrogenophaga sp. 5NK40-0174 TaxID=3127649 RepID=UPI0031057583